MTTTRAPVAGTLLAGRYRLVTALPGRGRWRAHDDIRDRDLLAREVALPDAERDQAWQQVLRDAAVVARKQHPGIVHLVDAVMDEGVAWVLTEVPAGRGLGDLVRRYGPMPPAEVARIGLDALDALDAAGVPHGNLTPDDVLIGPEGQVAVSGFAATGVGAGTRGFQPPEGGAGAKADLWALGATLFVAVEGRMPSGAAVRAGALGPALDGLLAADPDRRVDVAGARRLLETAASAPAGPIPTAGNGPARPTGMPAGPDGRTWNGAAQAMPGSGPNTRSGPSRPPAMPAGPETRGRSGPARPAAGPDGGAGNGLARPPVMPAGPGSGGRSGPVRPGPGANGFEPPARPAGPPVAGGASGDGQVHDPEIAAALAMLQAALAPVSPPVESEQPAGTTRAPDSTRPAAESRPAPVSGPTSPGASEVDAADSTSGSPDASGDRPVRLGPPMVARPEPARPSALMPPAGQPQRVGGSDTAADRPVQEAAAPGRTPDQSTPPGRTPDQSTPPGRPAGPATASRRQADQTTAPDRQADDAAAQSRQVDEATTRGRQVDGAAAQGPQADQAAAQGRQVDGAAAQRRQADQTATQGRQADQAAAQGRSTGATAADPATTAADRATSADPATAPGRRADEAAPPARSTGSTAADRATTADRTTAPGGAVEPNRPADRTTAPGEQTDRPTPTGAEAVPPAVRSGGTDTEDAHPEPPPGVRSGDTDTRDTHFEPPTRTRRRLVGPAVAAVVLAVLAAVLVPYLLRGGDDDGTAAPPPATNSAQATPTAPSPSAAEPPPAGYQLYRDPAGWSVAVPAGWRPVRRGTATTFTDQGRTLKISYRDNPPADPYEDALQLEPIVTAATPGYDLARIAAVPYRGWPTADWEYRAGIGVQTRTLTRAVVPSPDRGYSISWTTPERTFAADRDYFDIAARTFSPAP